VAWFGNVARGNLNTIRRIARDGPALPWSPTA
jgi:hypothetical protein